MKSKLFLLPLFFLLLLFGCNKDKITLEVLSPKDDSEFLITDEIEVKVTASTQKGSIIQVQLDVNGLDLISLTNRPYNFTIPKGTFPEKGIYYLSVTAFSSKGMQEGNAIYIKII